MNVRNRRDRAVDDLLRHSFAAAADERSSDACLDSETMAAWVDGALESDALAAAEMHASTCARCRAALAAMVRTTPPAAPLVPWWRRAWSIRVLVPLTATVIAAGVWQTMTRQPSPATERVSSPAEVTSRAQLQPPPGTQEVERGPASPAEPATRQSVENRSAAAGAAAPEPSARPATPLAASEGRATGVVAPAPIAGNEFRAEARREAESPAVGGVRDAPATDAVAGLTVQRRADEQALQKSAERDGRAGVAAPPPSQKGLAFERGAAGTAASLPSAAAPADRAAAVPPAPSDRTSELAAARSMAPQRVVISSPDSAVRWRMAQGAQGAIVERSTDGGATWRLQTVEPGGALIAGSAPSPSVCWLVGRAGRVFVTTDGETWRRVPFPESVDLIRVDATDAQTAAVTTSDGRTFRTIDGTSWTR